MLTFVIIMTGNNATVRITTLIASTTALIETIRAPIETAATATQQTCGTLFYKQRMQFKSALYCNCNM